MTAAVRAWRALGILTALAASAALLLSAVLYLDARDNVRERAEAVREGQIFNCYILGEPLVNAVIHGLQNQNVFAAEDTKADKAIPPEFFPDIPPSELERLLQQGAARNRALIAENKQIIKTLRGAPPCERRYPPVSP